MTETDTRYAELKDWLADHPRMIGALFTLLLVLSQAGAVAAGGGSGYSGP